MVRKKVVAIAKPTIAEVLEQFLAEQGKHLAAGTLAKYEKIVTLLKHCLNNYAPIARWTRPRRSSSIGSTTPRVSSTGSSARSSGRSTSSRTSASSSTTS